MTNYTITTEEGTSKGTAADAIRSIQAAQKAEGWTYVQDEDGVLVAGYSGDTAEHRPWGLDSLRAGR